MQLVNCDVNDFYAEVMGAYEGMVAEAERDIQADVYAAADDAAEELRHATGAWSQTKPTDERPAYFYEKGWKAYHHEMREGHVEARVANKNAPSLTHLVEKGHELFLFGRDTGRRTKARPHIREAYEHARAKHFGG